LLPLQHTTFVVTTFVITCSLLNVCQVVKAFNYVEVLMCSAILMPWKEV